MSTEKSESRDKSHTTSEPDSGTLHNTDPQKNMEGPVSSMVHQTGEQFDTEETKDEADSEKNKKM